MRIARIWLACACLVAAAACDRLTGDTSPTEPSGPPASGSAINYTVVGASQEHVYGGDPRSISWTDGTPSATGSNWNGVYVAGVGNGFRTTAPAGTTARTLTVYVGGWNSTGHLMVTLSDGSAPAYTRRSSISWSSALRGLSVYVNCKSEVPRRLRGSG